MNNDSSARASSFQEKIANESGLSHSQVQIWTGQKVHPNNPFCNMAFAIVIEGTIEVPSFLQAWQNVVSNNNVLRSRIEEKNGIPRLEFHEENTCSTDFIDLSKEANPVDAFNEFAIEKCSIPLSLEGELVDSTLAKLSDNRYGWYLNQHHLVTDATATVLLFKEVSESYKKLIAGEPIAASPSQSYYDIGKQAPGESDEFRDNAKRHWSEKKSDIPRITALYGQKGDPSCTKSERIEYTLTIEESNAIRALCDEPEFQSFFPDISIYTVFSTLLCGLLYRISGQKSLSFDSPAGNRATRAAKQSLGCFIEMFPFDVEHLESDTFRSLGARCMDEVRDFLANVSPGASSPNGANASNVVLNYFPQSFGTFAGHNVNAEWIHSGHIDGVYDFKFQVHDYNGTGQFTIQFDLSSDTLSSNQRHRISAHFRSLLGSMLDDLDTNLSACDILLESERQQTLEVYNVDCGNQIPNKSIIEFIAKQVADNPDRIALRQKSKVYSFSDLWKTVERNALALRTKGISSESLVVVSMKRSAEAVIAILSVLRSGGAFAPVDPSYPSARIEKILADSKAALILTHEGLGQKFPMGNIPICDFSELASVENSDSSPLPLPALSDLAYVIYTSGSTGQPKGVEIEHCGMIDYLEWASRQYTRGAVFKFPLFTSLSFDLTITSLFLPLMTGGELIVYEQQISEVDSALIDVINENSVDFIKLTPSHMSLLNQMDLGEVRITRMVVGGEDLKSKLAAAISEQFGASLEIYNEYGPTECVVGCMIHRFQTEDATNGTSVPIGKPADHVKLYLLNEELKPVPEGTPGELCIARNGIARGYRNDLAKTNAAFVENPFQPGEILYRTGDLVRFSATSVMTFLGRIDSQVKMSGHRIELGEIEAALLEHSSVQSAFVTTLTTTAHSKQPEVTSYCRTCGLASNYPNVFFDDDGVCGICSAFDSIKDEANTYFETKDSLRALFEKSRRENDPQYDCMVFYSGGKDSSYTLCKLVDEGLKVYAFTLDNGYLSDQAMSNIDRVVKTLGVDHEFASTPAMNEIFKDSLTRFSNVCNGCFKTIYTLGMNRAHELRIPIIVTGLSRGQFFETRLTENLFHNGKFSPNDVDVAVLEARKAYHKVDDAPSRCLDTSLFQNDQIFDEIKFVDFYRYWDASLEELYGYLAKRVPWIRPSDTGRSTNCLVNDVGIYIHNKERGYHNYALPYSWDVRMDHKKRDEALEELDDQYEIADVKRMLGEIGYDENRLTRDADRTQLIAYYIAENPLPLAELDSHLSKSLPAQMRPRHFIHLDAMPLTANGKVDPQALPKPDVSETKRSTPIVAPDGPVQEHVHSVWVETFKTGNICVRDSFFQLGGTSLDAMELTLRLCNDFEINIPLQAIFKNPTIGDLSILIEAKILEDIENLSDDEAEEILNSTRS